MPPSICGDGSEGPAHPRRGESSQADGSNVVQRHRGSEGPWQMVSIVCLPLRAWLASKSARLSGLPEQMGSALRCLRALDEGAARGIGSTIDGAPMDSVLEASGRALGIGKTFPLGIVPR